MLNWIAYFPIGLFASVMGLSGLSIAYQRFEQIFDVRLGIGQLLLVVSYVVFSAAGLIYLGKLLLHTRQAAEEFNHPVKVSFFPAISISLLLLSVASLEVWREAAQYVWVCGAVAQLVFTIVIMSRWLRGSIEITNANPAWFIPVVGNIIVPIAGVDFAHKEIGWFFFSIGLFFWFVMVTVLFQRLIFYKPLPPKLLPTLFILAAPPAVGFIAYVRLTGEMDVFARILFYIAVFFVILLFSMARSFAGMKFFVSWWAYTFPLCAVTIASILAYKLTGLVLLAWLAKLLLVVTTLIVGTVALKTLQAFGNKSVCIPD